MGLCLSLLAEFVFSQTRYHTKNLDDSNGLPNTDVWDVYKDHWGYYWIATLNGLTRYDGYQAINYQHSKYKNNTIGSNRCLQIIGYQDNYLIINNFKGFSIYRNAYDDFVSVSLRDISPYLENTSITNIISCNGGRLYAGLNNGSILIYDQPEILRLISDPRYKPQHKILRFKYDNILINSSMEFINMDPTGNLWLCYHHGLYMVRKFRAALNDETIKISDQTFNFSCVDSDNRIWFGAYSGDLVYLTADTQKGYEIKSVRQDISKQVKVEFIGFGDMKQDDNKNYYISLNNGGFITARLENGALKVIDHAYNLPNAKQNDIISNNINSLSLFDNHVLCLSTSEGVTFINLQSLQLNNYITLFKDTQQPFDKSVTCISEFKDYLLCGTESDGVYTLKLDTTQQRAYAGKLLDERILIYDILIDPGRDKIYVASENGLYVLAARDIQPGRTVRPIQHIHRKTHPILHSSVIISLALDKNHNLWLGTGRGLNYMDVQSGIVYDVLQTDNARKMISGNIIRDVIIDQNKTIWLASEDGLIEYQLNAKKIQLILMPDTNDAQRIGNIYIDTKNNFWVGTANGIYVRKSGTDNFVNIKNPYSNYSISVKCFAENENGQIWVSTESGLYQITDFSITARYSKNDGLNSNVFNYNALLHSQNGNIIIGSKRGVHIFDDQKIIRYPNKAKLIVSDIRLNDKSLLGVNKNSSVYQFRNNHKVYLTAGTNFFTIAYSLLGSPFSENVLYQCRLDGLSDEWQNVGSRNEINFSNVKHGSYLFQVRASVGNNEWAYLSEPIAINIAPYFYQTWWFRLSVGLMLAFLLSIFIYLRFQTIQANRDKELAYHKAKMTELFLANMNHEIRTPLNAIHGFTKLLIEKQPRNDQYMYLHSMKQSSDHLMVIINDILDIAKIDAGKMNIERHTYDIEECISHVESAMKAKAIDKGISFKIHYDYSVPKYIYGDSTRFIQVLFNLAGNAIKFTDEGSVEVHIHSIPPENQNDKPKLFVKVKDTGIGIPKSKYHRIFESFSQADNETTRKYGGTGLGLAICKSLLELQDGRIWFESEEGIGTTFYFELPYTPSSAEHVTQIDNKSLSRYAEEMEGMHVLLVEDNDFNRIVAAETIKYYFPGVIIDTANNGLDAIKKYRVNNYDLIIMDIQMPEMDGYEATRFIRTQFPEDKKDIHILAMSANALQPDIAKIYESGMNDFLPKPFEINDMALKMVTALRASRSKASGTTSIHGQVDAGNIGC